VIDTVTDQPESTVRTPQERIVRTDILLNVFNPDEFMRHRRRFVNLECGHKALTSAWERTTCLRCSEMLRRSIADGSEDYDAYRYGDGRDRMSWPEDPCRAFNEPTDLEGNYVRE
jgi:hypothetical protein